MNLSSVGSTVPHYNEHLAMKTSRSVPVGCGLYYEASSPLSSWPSADSGIGDPAEVGKYVPFKQSRLKGQINPLRPPFQVETVLIGQALHERVGYLHGVGFRVRDDQQVEAEFPNGLRTFKTYDEFEREAEDLNIESVQSRPKGIDQSIMELHSLVGLTSIKHEMETLIPLAKTFLLRRQKGLAVPEISLHLAFSGNPGTGKTTVARIIADVYGQLGLLSKGQLVEVDRGGLVGNYVGQTATKVQSVIEKAKGGILFIDEAYAYKMEEFLSANPGLRSRFPRVIVFPDYSAAELVDIFDKMAKAAQYFSTPAARDLVKRELNARWLNRGPEFANAREFRNFFERVIAAQSDRLSATAAPSAEMLSTLEDADIMAASSDPVFLPQPTPSVGVRPATVR
jgi:ATPase family associated with various cellular activities (AAA)/AAA lid domain